MNQSINIWTLPTAIQILSNLREELSQGVSLCIVVATPTDLLEFENVLRDALLIQDCLMVCSLDLRDFESINLASLQKAITGEKSEAVSFEQFIQSETTPNVIFLKGFDEISAQIQKDTITFIRRWADSCHAISEKKSLCLIVSGSLADKINDLRKSTTMLKLIYLAGIPSALEMQLICRAYSGGEFTSPEAHWREFLVSSLAGSDMDMAYLLLQSNLDTIDDINCVLREYAELNSWKRSTFVKDLKTWVPLAGGMKPEIPQNVENMKLLRKQTTVYTPEYGEEIHPAGLALLERYDEIKHRVWRSQTNLVFPIIDELRIRIFSLLRNKLVITWEHEEIPEIGELKYSLDQLPAYSFERKRYYDIIRHARDIRNKLAHTEVITLREYSILWNSLQKIRQMTVPN
jgi:hypothetical protein